MCPSNPTSLTFKMHRLMILTFYIVHLAGFFHNKYPNKNKKKRCFMNRTSVIHLPPFFSDCAYIRTEKNDETISGHLGP